MGDGMDELDTRFEYLVDRVTALDIRLKNLEDLPIPDKKTIPLLAMIMELGNRVEALGLHESSFGRNLLDLDSRLTALEARLQPIDSASSMHGGILETLNDRLTALEEHEGDRHGPS